MRRCNAATALVLSVVLVVGGGGVAVAAESSATDVVSGSPGSSYDQIDTAVTLIAAGGMIGIIAAWAMHRGILPGAGASVPGGVPVPADTSSDVVAGGVAGRGVTGGFPNCDAARRAGLTTPIQQGQPGYSPALDHDKDGVACE